MSTFRTNPGGTLIKGGDAKAQIARGLGVSRQTLYGYLGDKRQSIQIDQGSRYYE